MTNNELQHWGIKGMKWGVRRYQNADGSLTLAGRYHQYKTRKKRKAALEKARETRAVNKAAAEKRAKDLAEGRISARKMTNEELTSAIARLEMEKKYKDLSNQTMSRGKRLVMDVAEKSVKNIAEQATTYAIGTAMNSIYKTVTDTDVDIVNPRKGQKDK